MPSSSSQSIPPEVAQLLASASFDQEGVGKIVAVLPEDDATLHGWLVAKAEELKEREFSLLCAAAEMTRRALPASLLPQMLALGLDYSLLARLAWRMEAEVTEQLLEGLEGIGPPGNCDRWRCSSRRRGGWSTTKKNPFLRKSSAPPSN